MAAAPIPSAGCRQVKQGWGPGLSHPWGAELQENSGPRGEMRTTTHPQAWPTVQLAVFSCPSQVWGDSRVL